MINATNEIPLFSLDGHNCESKIVSIYDADTCSAIIELNGKFTKFKLRLVGIDSPEIRPLKSVVDRDNVIKKAKCARNRLVQLVTDQEIDCDKQYTKKELQEIVDKSKKLIYIECGGFDKYGRLLATLYSKSTDKKKSVNNLLIEEGHAYAYNGGTKRI
jgi:endonuclease YncB( thermonuclease family)